MNSSPTKMLTALVMLMACANINAQEIVEDFEILGNPTTAGWSVGLGGVAIDADGAGDHALEYTTNNNFHFLHPWAGATPNPLFLGNFPSKSVTRISFRARRVTLGGPGSVALRATLFDDTNGTNWAVSKSPTDVTLGWNEYQIDLCPEDLYGPFAGPEPAAILANVHQIGLRHQPLSGGTPGNPNPVFIVPTTVLFDDIRLSTGDICGDMADERFGDLNSPTTGGWTVGSGSAVADAGDAGARDHAVQYIANHTGGNNGFHFYHAANGPAPNPVFLGTFHSLGLGTRISFRARRALGDPVTLRAVLFDDFTDGTDWAQTNATATVSSTAWETFEFDLCPLDLMTGGANGLSANQILAGVTQFGLRHDPAGTGPGSPSPVAAPTAILFDDINRSEIFCPVPDQCGDAAVQLNETCDDGNVVSSDGCSDTCQIEEDNWCTAPTPEEPSVCTDWLVDGGQVYVGTTTLCTGTCASFDALDVGSNLTLRILLDKPGPAAFDDTDIRNLLFEISHPGEPASGPGNSPLTDNPLVISASTAVSMGSAGTINSQNEVDGGQLSIKLLHPPFVDNDAYFVFDLATGIGELCLFYTTAGCIPGATQAAKFEGQFYYVGHDRDGDGLASHMDNCSAVANPDQRDTDSDTYGNRCDADLNNDCIVNFVDLANFPSVFLTTDPDADFNGDGVVNFIDLSIFQSLFLLPPGPGYELAGPLPCD